MIIKVYYKPPYYERRISYFRVKETFMANFTDTLKELYESLIEKPTKEIFEENIIDYINRFCDRLQVEEVE